MDQALINQFNRAVDKGDALVKQALLAEVKPVKYFIQRIGRGGAEMEPLFRLLNYDADEARLIAPLVHLLGFFLSQMAEQGEKPPQWLLSWYRKAHAWHYAVNLEIWDETRKF
jgi:hypothetical protein